VKRLSSRQQSVLAISPTLDSPGVRAAREDWRTKDYSAGSLLVIRRLSDGKVEWANAAAKAAGVS